MKNFLRNVWTRSDRNNVRGGSASEKRRILHTEDLAWQDVGQNTPPSISTAASEEKLAFYDVDSNLSKLNSQIDRHVSVATSPTSQLLSGQAESAANATKRPFKKATADKSNLSIPERTPPISSYQPELHIFVESVKLLSVYADCNYQVSDIVEEQHGPHNIETGSAETDNYVLINRLGSESFLNDPLESQFHAIPSPVEGTTSWVEDRDEYRNWLKAPPGQKVLLILAGPGLGKSVLAKGICKRLRDQAGQQKVYAFFCKATDMLRDKTLTIVASFVHKLLVDNQICVFKTQGWTSGDVDFLKWFEKNYKSGVTGLCTFQKLWELFSLLVERPSVSRNVYIVDGLDECQSSSQAELRSCLLRSVDSFKGRLIITGREEIGLNAMAVRFKATTIMANATTFSTDVQKFVLQKLQDNGTADFDDYNTRPMIQERVSKDAGGIFLLLSCWFDGLKTQIEEATNSGHRLLINEKTIQDLVNQPYPQLGHYFAQAFRDMVKSPQVKVGTAILSLILAAQRPFSQVELIAAYQFSQKKFASHEKYRSERPQYLLLEAKTVCGPLVQIQGDFRSDSSTIDVVHEKARKVLQDKTLIDLEKVPNLSPVDNDHLLGVDTKQGHLLIAKACLEYLLLPGLLGIGPLEQVSSAQLSTIIDSRPFMRYAVQFWPVHVAKCEERLFEFQGLFKRFLKAPEQGFAFWSNCRSIVDSSSSGEEISEYQPIAHTIIQYNMVQVVQQVSSGDDFYDFIDWNQTDALGRTALLLALEKDNTNLAARLLELGADPNLANDRGIMPLYAAALIGSEALMRLCVAKGANVDAEIHENGETLLWWSLGNTSIAIFDLLIGLGARKVSRSSDRRLILHEAAYYNQVQFVQYMLKTKLFGVNQKDSGGMTALIAAAGARDGLKTVRYLATHANLDFNAKTQGGQNALWAALYFGQLDTAEYLLPRIKHKDIACSDTPEFEGWTPLHICASRGYRETAITLLKASCNINAMTDYGDTPLMLAIQHDQPELAMLLLRRGADFKLRNNEDSFPLYAASQKAYPEVVKALLDMRADDRAKRNNISSLLIAVWNNRAANVELLIKARLPDQDFGEVEVTSGFSLLHYAFTRRSLTVIKLLVAAGAGLFAPSASGCIAIHEVCRNMKDDDLFDLLLSKLPHDMLDVQDNNGMNPLMFAAESGFVYAVKRLLELGASSSIVSKFGNTALMHAAWSGSTTIMRLLLDSGRDCKPNMRDKHGWSALLTACEFCHDQEMIEQLLELDPWQQQSRLTGSPMVIAASHNNIAAVKALLKHGMPADFCADDGFTALYAAAGKRHGEIVKLLLQQGAQPTAWSYCNVAPYVVAMDDQYWDTPSELLPQDMDCLTRRADTNFIKSIHVAARFDTKTLKSLVVAGISPIERAIMGGNALREAVQYCNTSAIEYLLGLPEILSQIEVESAIGRKTVLTEAVLLRSPESVRLILEKGHANVYHIDNHGLCVFDYARKHERTLSVLKRARPEAYKAWQLSYKTRDNIFEKQMLRKRIVCLVSWIQQLDQKSLLFERASQSAAFCLSTMLIHAGDTDNALTALELNYGAPSGSFDYTISCSRCFIRKSGRVFVCSQCPYTSFCGDCRKDSKQMRTFGCEDHLLLQYPRDSWKSRKPEHVNDEKETLEVWLKKLVAKYESEMEIPDLIEGSESKARQDPTMLEAGMVIKFDYPAERANVFKFCQERDWQQLAKHLSVYPRDVHLTDTLGDSMAIWAVRNIVSDAECLKVLKIMSHEAVTLLTSNSRNESSILLACKRGFQECVTFLLSVYDYIFNKTEDKSSSETLRIIVAKGWHEALVFAIERHLRWASTGDFSFLKQFDEERWTDGEIVRFLEENPDFSKKTNDEQKSVLANRPKPSFGQNTAPRA